MIPNRIVIGAIDSALNRVDIQLRNCSDPHWIMKQKIDALAVELRAERDALVEARYFIIDNRKDQ